MPAWIYYLGVLCVSYFVSRLTLRLFARLRPPQPRRGRREQPVLATIAPPHLAAFALIAGLIFWLRNYDPLQVLPYLPAQAIWLGVDFLRKYRPVSRGRSRMVNPFRLPRAGLAIAAIMTVAAVGYTGRAFALFMGDTSYYAAIEIGAPHAQALYAAGPPTLTQAAPDAPFRAGGDPLTSTAWYYRSPQTIVRFDAADQRVGSVLCVGPRRGSQASCPPTLLLAVGNYEWDVSARLGEPTATAVFGGRKVMRYPELGLEFVLEQFLVRAIRASPDNNDRLRKLYRFVRYAIP